MVNGSKPGKGASTIVVPDTPENAQRCSCPGCPSNPSGSTELYCGRPLAVPDLVRKGCLCGICPLTKVYDLDDEYYCAGGPEAG
jgi:hypothetical protein